jgi:hypothetical protein
MMTTTMSTVMMSEFWAHQIGQIDPVVDVTRPLLADGMGRCSIGRLVVKQGKWCKTMQPLQLLLLPMLQQLLASSHYRLHPNCGVFDQLSHLALPGYDPQPAVLLFDRHFEHHQLGPDLGCSLTVFRSIQWIVNLVGKTTMLLGLMLKA